MALDKLSFILPDDKPDRNVLQKVGDMGPESMETEGGNLGGVSMEVIMGLN